MPDQAEIPWTIAGNYLFHFAAWQVFFFTAMALGYHRDQLAPRFSPGLQRGLLAVTGVAFVGLIVLYRLGNAPWQWLAPLGSPASPHDRQARVSLKLQTARESHRPRRSVAWRD